MCKDQYTALMFTSELCTITLCKLFFILLNFTQWKAQESLKVEEKKIVGRRDYEYKVDR